MAKTTQSASGPRPYASVNLTPAALGALRRTLFTVQAAAGRRVPMSDVVTALTVLASRREVELAEILAARSALDFQEGQFR